MLEHSAVPTGKFLLYFLFLRVVLNEKGCEDMVAALVESFV